MGWYSGGGGKSVLGISMGEHFCLGIKEGRGNLFGYYFTYFLSHKFKDIFFA